MRQQIKDISVVQASSKLGDPRESHPHKHCLCKVSSIQVKAGCAALRFAELKNVQLRLTPLKEPLKGPSVQPGFKWEEGSIFSAARVAFHERFNKEEPSEPFASIPFARAGFLTRKSLPGRERTLRRSRLPQPGHGAAATHKVPRAMETQPPFYPHTCSWEKVFSEIQLGICGIIPRLREWIKVFANFSG